MLRRAWNTESRSWRAAAVCLGLALFHLTPIPALADLDRASQAETVNRALQQGDHERALEALQPLVEAGDEQAIKFDRFIRAFVELLKQREAQKKAEGPVDLRDYDRRYKADRTEEQEARFQQAQTALAAKDYKTAMEIWSALAKLGDAQSQDNLADSYSIGRGVTKNKETAQKYYLMAAEQGYAPAQESLSRLHDFMMQLEDETVRRRSFVWTYRAAVQGNVMAYARVSLAYCYGYGIDRNPVMADVWQYLTYASRDYLVDRTCRRYIKYPASYVAAIEERAIALSKAYDIPIYPPYGTLE